MYQAQDHDLSNRVLATYPFPIAFTYRDSVVEAPNEAGLVGGIIHTFTVVIQYVALIAASEYDSAGFVDDATSAALHRLKYPLLSSLTGLTEAVGAVFRSRGHVPMVREFGAFVERLAR